jgi:hypothetical protein
MSSYKNLGQLCKNPRDEGSPSLGNCPGLPANRLECAIYHTCYNSIGLCVRPILRAHSHSPPFSRMYASVAPDGDEGKRQVPPAHRLLKLLRSFLSRRLRRSRSQHLDHELALPTPMGIREPMLLLPPHRSHVPARTLKCQLVIPHSSAVLPSY